MRSAAATPSALAWNCAAALRSGAYSSGASTRIVSAGAKPDAAAVEADADLDGDDRRAERRRELEHERREEGDPQRAHRLAPVGLARLGERSAWIGAAVERAQRR